MCAAKDFFRQRLYGVKSEGVTAIFGLFMDAFLTSDLVASWGRSKKMGERRSRVKIWLKY